MLSERLSFRLGELREAWNEGGVLSLVQRLGNRAWNDLYGAFRRGLAYLRSSDGLVLLKIQGSWMYLRLDDPGISRQLIRDGIREPEQTRLICEEVKPGMVGVDIGANLGYYALMEARLVGPAGQIYAIEPVPENVEILRRNIAVNGLNNVKILECAISAVTERMDFLVSKASNCGALRAESAHMCGWALPRHHEKCISVMALSLDDFLVQNHIPKVNFIRMDVEGHEVMVTEGMRRFLRQAQVPLKLFIEVHNPHFREPLGVYGPWLERLMQQGFRPKVLGVDGKIMRGINSESFAAVMCSYRTKCPHVLLEKG